MSSWIRSIRRKIEGFGLAAGITYRVDSNRILLASFCVARYVALLRGINVGGKNIIKMADLQESFGRMGFSDAATYIQSGNVVFSSQGGAAGLTSRIEKTLSRDFAYDASVMLRSLLQMREIIQNAPAGFGGKPKEYRYDVLFLKKGLVPGRVIKEISVRQGSMRPRPERRCCISAGSSRKPRRAI